MTDTDLKPLDTSATLDVEPLVVSDPLELAAEQLYGVDVLTMGMRLSSEQAVTVCIICSDEDYDEYLPECLDNLPDFADVVVVRNRRGEREELMLTSLEKVGAQSIAYFDWTWIGDRFDFGRGRNIVSALAGSPWLLHLDADERVYEHERLKALCDVLPDDVGGAHCTMVWHQYHGRGRELNARRGVFPILRLVRNRPDIFWNWCIHEQVLPSIEFTGMQVVDTRLCIVHDGYVCSAEKLVSKGRRNLEALVYQYERTPCAFLEEKIRHEQHQLKLIEAEAG